VSPRRPNNSRYRVGCETDASQRVDDVQMTKNSVQNVRLAIIHFLNIADSPFSKVKSIINCNCRRKLYGLDVGRTNAITSGVKRGQPAMRRRLNDVKMP
jgi:hypothetical protein